MKVPRLLPGELQAYGAAGLNAVAPAEKGNDASAPLVSIIIPTRDQPALLERCLASIVEKSGTVSYEIIIVDVSDMVIKRDPKVVGI